MILCANGGYAAVLATGIREGRYTAELAPGGAVFRATLGSSGAAAFTLTAPSDDTARTGLSQSSVDHGEMACVQLEAR